MSSIKKVLDEYPDISFIEDMTIESLQNEMIEDYCERYCELTDNKNITLGLADPVRLILYATSLQIYQALQFIDASGKKSLLKYSYGDFLENLGALKGIYRKLGIAAKTVMRFTLSTEQDSNIYIAAGTRVTAGDEVYFQTTTDAEILAGELYIDVDVECIENGTKGNGYEIGCINILVDQIAYIASVANIYVTDGGVDKENDEQLAERIYFAPASYSTAGPEDAYIYWIKNCNPDISDVKVTSPERGVVEVRFIMQDGTLPSDVIINDVKQYLSEKKIRPLTDLVEVAAPAREEIEIDVSYYIAESDRSKVATIQANVAEAIQSYKIWQTSKIGRDINPDHLMRLIVNAGAKRAVIRSPQFLPIADDRIACVISEKLTYGGIESD